MWFAAEPIDVRNRRGNAPFRQWGEYSRWCWHRGRGS